MQGISIKLDFLVLGAQKAGTTTLHSWLATHPEVALPTNKETRFFSHAAINARGKQWYLRQFPDHSNARITGEVDPEYLYNPVAAENILKMSTARKFVVLLRNPLERALSHYLMSRRRGYENLAFKDALEQEETRLAEDANGFGQDHWTYTSRSLYGEQISRFRDIIPDGEFLFIRSDELSHGGYDSICAFLGIDPTLGRAERAERLNSASAQRSRALSNLLHAPNGKSDLRRFIVKCIPTKVKRYLFLSLDNLNRKAIVEDRETFYYNIPPSILSVMVNDLHHTESITGLDLSDWKRDLSERLRGKH